MRDVASAYYHSLHPSGTPPLLPIPLPAPSTSRRADIPEADTRLGRELLHYSQTRCVIGECSAAVLRPKDSQTTIETRLLDTERRIMTALELVNRRVTYQKGPFNVRAVIEGVLEDERDVLTSKRVFRPSGLGLAADDLLLQYIMRTQALEARACVDTLEGPLKMAPKRATRSTPVTTTPAPTTTTTTTVTNAQLQAMIDQGVSAALAARDATRNDTDSHSSGTGVRGSECVA
ncbi:hypothetical protein Tco_1003132 [Tanacetum coccineum]|uniref:Chorismate mutase n=1 Tax=Tanacetum coccineum TaxID=301880 RepID=A0ABQ5F9C1_9ASTR